MEANYWHQKWQRGDIAFHRDEANLHLVAHLAQLELTEGDRVFLPLCGKTRDIAYLLSCSYQVLGVELSELAICELFEDLSIAPQVSLVEGFDGFHRYQADGITIFVGDFFKLSAELTGEIAAIYDRAALVALPRTMRNDYAKHLIKLSHNARQLLVTYEYQQELIDGPPFSISEQEVREHYGETYKISMVDRAEVEGGLKGKVPSSESVYLLR
ncbi:thiopurine S-methyltransferase [Undibacterium flavidum]|uniref:Thiopurine S-methyltransferase n=1 Tax=Undibacterium flavidum TaxID=2762297 RepID=A0ABR6Y8Y9_9BURK|nr:thiopurine S-methyltransferase [Undibacterium flavidum]MBC3872677.1 thiopurine S-methyltransferase [Undibacterium flavidum]